MSRFFVVLCVYDLLINEESKSCGLKYINHDVKIVFYGFNNV